MAGRPAPDILKHYVVGSLVRLRGTGKWWDGKILPATIVDIRPSDDTVKVRYVDGGYKRLTREELEELLTPAPELVDAFSFKSPAIDYFPEVHEDVERTMRMTDLNEAIGRAVAQKDFLSAHELKERYEKEVAVVDAERALRAELWNAIAGQDYLKAHELQQAFQKKETQQLDPPKPNFGETMTKAGKRALGGGLSGAAAMVLQVSTLMWMRTIMNCQYRHGGTFSQAAKRLYAEGGVLRFYRGYLPGLIQGPFSRFGDTFANAGVLALFDSSESLRNTPIAVKTSFASAGAATMRIVLTPVDTVKTIMQVEGKNGLPLLRQKYKVGGVPAFFHGAMATSAATFVGHYPWFTTYNLLQASIAVPEERPKKFARNAAIGFTAGIISDTVSNSLRVVKTFRQTSSVEGKPIPYAECVKSIVDKDGYLGLFGRGLKTRIVCNGCQSMMFSVCYKLIEERFALR